MTKGQNGYVCNRVIIIMIELKICRLRVLLSGIIYIKCFVNCTLCHHHDNTGNKYNCHPGFTEKQKRGSERLIDLPKVTQLIVPESWLTIRSSDSKSLSPSSLYLIVHIKWHKELPIFREWRGCCRWKLPRKCLEGMYLYLHFTRLSLKGQS